MAKIPIHHRIKGALFPLSTFHIRHKKKLLKLALFFLMALTFAIIEDIIAVASVAHIGAVVEALPTIFIISVIFTFLSEYLEEKFDPKKGPLEKAVEIVESDIGYKKRSHKRRKQL